MASVGETLDRTNKILEETQATIKKSNKIISVVNIVNIITLLAMAYLIFIRT